MDAIDAVTKFIGWEPYLQLAIPAGYLGYLIARSGVSKNDRPISILFLCLLFSLISTLAWKTSANFPIAWKITTAIMAPAIAAILWRKWIHDLTIRFLHHFRICNTSFYPDLWTEITENTELSVTQITVFLKNGQALTCDDVWEFDNAPLDKVRWDNDGNIALYVTRERLIEQEPFQKVTTSAKHEGGEVNYYRLTYVPKDKIERVEFVTNRPYSKKHKNSFFLWWWSWWPILASGFIAFVYWFFRSF